MARWGAAWFGMGRSRKCDKAQLNRNQKGPAVASSALILVIVPARLCEARNGMARHGKAMTSPNSQFDKAVEIILGFEGGFVDHPSDPGGATFKGVSLGAVVGLRDENGDLQFDLDKDNDTDTHDIRLLEEAWNKGDTELIVNFYRKRYWDAVKGDEIRWPFNLLAFDAAVNHGPRSAIVMLQKSIGVPADGLLGPRTMKALNAKPLRETLVKYLVLRARLYADLSVKRGFHFYNGWMSRLFELQSESMRRV